jgi:hypothetical protein
VALEEVALRLPQAGVVDSQWGAAVAEADSPTLSLWEAEEAYYLQCGLPAKEEARVQEDSARVKEEEAGANQS